MILGGLGVMVCMTLGFIGYLRYLGPQPNSDASTPTERVVETAPNPPSNPDPSKDRNAPSDPTEAKDAKKDDQLHYLVLPPVKNEPIPPQIVQAPPPPLPPEHQTKVDAAIRRGVEFLKAKQTMNGGWNDDYHPAGLTALPALTLVECGVSAEDPRIDKAFLQAKKSSAVLQSTYEIALIILFLDRLGNPDDKPLIRSLALRLIAGQTQAGGWSYQCPFVLTKQEGNLLTVLDALRPASHEELLVKDAPDAPLPPPPQKGDGAMNGPTGKRAEDLEGKAKAAYAALTPALKRIPSLSPPSDSHQLPLADHSDNSNTQFAALALWAAGRHGVPVERALALTAARFRFCQSINGGWDYPYQVPSHASTASMTCAGLLGLGLGHGLIVRYQSHPTHSAKVDDAAIRRGMKELAGFVGEPGEYADKKDRPSVNLYYLWSLGRVGLLYRTHKIDGKDWYAWGVNQVLAWQEVDGSWKTNVYADATPVVNTCFALLFLKRSHLTEDVSKALNFDLEGKKPREESK
jgi:hypothetical protein